MFQQAHLTVCWADCSLLHSVGHWKQWAVCMNWRLVLHDRSNLFLRLLEGTASRTPARLFSQNMESLFTFLHPAGKAAERILAVSVPVLISAELVCFFTLSHTHIHRHTQTHTPISSSKQADSLKIGQLCRAERRAVRWESPWVKENAGERL